MKLTALRCEALESRDAMSTTLASVSETEPVQTSDGGAHILYQDVVVPDARSNQGWGKWEVTLAVNHN